MTGAARVVWGVSRGLGHTWGGWLPATTFLALFLSPLSFGPFDRLLRSPIPWLFFVFLVSIPCGRIGHDVGSAHPGLPISPARRIAVTAVLGSAVAAALGVLSALYRPDVYLCVIAVGGAAAALAPAAPKLWAVVDRPFVQRPREAIGQVSGPIVAILRELFLRTPLGSGLLLLGGVALAAAWSLPAQLASYALFGLTAVAGLPILGDAHATRPTRVSGRIPGWLPLSNTTRLRSTLVVHGGMAAFVLVVTALAVGLAPAVRPEVGLVVVCWNLGIGLATAGSARVEVRVGGGLLVVAAASGLSLAVRGGELGPTVVWLDVAAAGVLCAYAASWGAKWP